MSVQRVRTPIFAIYHAIAVGLESIRHLPAPIGPLARTIWQGEGPDDDHNHLTVFNTGPTSIIVLTATH